MGPEEPEDILAVGDKLAEEDKLVAGYSLAEEDRLVEEDSLAEVQNQVVAWVHRLRSK